MYEVYWDKTLVGFVSTLNMPSGTVKNAFREHRLVVLPDFQGLGFGTKISEFIGDYLLKKGCKYFSRTTHIRLGLHRRNSTKWVSTYADNMLRSTANVDNNGTSQGAKYKKIDDTRVAHCHEYVGGDYSKPHQIIVCNGECDIEIAKNLLDKIIDKNKFPIIVSGIASNSKITVWEDIAKDRGIRTEVLLIKRKGEYYRNKSNTNGDIDAILTTLGSREILNDIKGNINKCITCNNNGIGYYMFDKKLKKKWGI